MSDPFRIVDIHMHYGGQFIHHPNIRYTSDSVRVFHNCDPDELSTFSLFNLYSKIEKEAACAKFWYSIPDHDVDVGVIPINDDVDIELLTTCYEGLPFMHIYVEAGQTPLKIISPDGKLLFERVTNDGPLALPYNEGSSELNSDLTRKGAGASQNPVDLTGFEPYIGDTRGQENDLDGPTAVETNDGTQNPFKPTKKNKRKGGKTPSRKRQTVVQPVKRAARKTVRKLFQQTTRTSVETNQVNNEQHCDFDRTSLEKNQVNNEQQHHSDGNEEPDPDWLREGLEFAEDEDIFATAGSTVLQTNQQIGDLNEQQQQHQQPQGEESTAQHQQTEDLNEQQQQHQQRQGEESTAQHQQTEDLNKQQQQYEEAQGEESTAQHQHGGDQPIGPDSEEWNEPVTADEDFLYSGDENGPDYSYFNASVEFNKPNFELKVGKKFTHFTKFREALVEWNIREGYEVLYINNDSWRITAKCAKGCSWRIHASRINRTDTFQIKTLKGEHHCGREYTNKHATSTNLSRKFQEKVRDDPNCSLDGIINDARRRFMVNISGKKAYRTKRKAREAIKGCDMEQYERLWDYAATVRQSNPDSHIAIQIDRRSIEERATFQRLFYGLGALKKGFLAGCRPIIGLDGCFLKGPFGGQLLAALGRDGNDNMFPIAIAIVEAENYNSWTWFLKELITHIGRGNVVPYTFISDRQKGLVHAIEELFPGAEHRFCLRHLFENFKAKFKDSELRELFWATASATNGDDFKRALNALEIAQPQNGENLTAAGWLKRLPYHLWSRAHYGMAAKTDISVNNLNESFNNYILKARDEPIVTLLEFFRRKLMQRLTLKRQGMESYGGRLCPNIIEKLAKSIEKSRHCIAIFDGIESFEVDGFNRTSVVNLQHRSCSCGAFQLTGIPCVHAISAIQSMRMKVENYVDECYSKEAYLRAYAYSIGAVPSKEHWIDSGMQLLNPPFVKKQPGRPKKLRRRGPDEPRDPQRASKKGLPVYCKRCLKTGHNRRTCKEPPHPKSKLYKAPASNTQRGARTASTSAPTREAPVHQVSQQSSTAAVTDNNPSSRSKRFKKN